MTTAEPALAPVTAPARPLVGDAMVLDHDPSSVPAARACLAQRLAHLPDDLLDDTLLVLSELLGNAVRHGAAPTAAGAGGVEVRWTLVPGAVHLEVVDGGGGEPRVVDRGEHAVSGRGLTIVEALSRSWGTTALGGGRRAVWSWITAS